MFSALSMKQRLAAVWTRSGLLQTSFVLLYSIVFAGLGVGTIAAQGASGALFLPHTSSISGIVSSYAGALAGEKVAVYKVTTLHGHEILQRECVTVTDKDGAYLCRHLSPGSYVLAAEKKTGLQNSGASSIPLFFFYPGTLDLNSVVRITLRANEQQNVDMAVPYIAGHKVSAILDGDSRNITVSLYRVADSGLEYYVPSQLAVSKNGEFMFSDIPEGRYLLRARWFEQREEYGAFAEVNVTGKDEREIRLEPFKAGTLSVKVQTEGGNAPGPLSFAVEEIHTGSHLVAETENPDRVLAFPQIIPGDYNIFLSSPKTMCIQGVRRNGRDLNQPFPVTAMDQPMEIEVLIGGACGALEGALSTRSTGDLLLTTEDLNPVKAVRSDSNGRFRVTGVPYGQYRVFAWRSLLDIPYRNTAFLRGLKGNSVAIEINQSSPVTLPEVSVTN